MLDVVLSGQVAELELPGMIVRLRAAGMDTVSDAGLDEDDGQLSVQDLVRKTQIHCNHGCALPWSPRHITSLLTWRLYMQETFQQDLGDIIFGNLVSIALCLFATFAVCRSPSPSSTTHACVRTH